MHLYVCRGMHMDIGGQPGSHFSPPTVGPRGWTHVDSAGSKCPYPLNYLANLLRAPFWRAFLPEQFVLEFRLFFHD